MAKKSAATPAAAAPAVAAPAPTPKDTQNGVTRPGAGSLTGAVWAYADNISKNTKQPAKRADVLAACAAHTVDGKPAPINASTGATQYGKWRKYNGLKAEPREPKTEAAPAPAAAAPKGKAAKGAAAK